MGGDIHTRILWMMFEVFDKRSSYFLVPGLPPVLSNAVYFTDKESLPGPLRASI